MKHIILPFPKFRTLEKVYALITAVLTEKSSAISCVSSSEVENKQLNSYTFSTQFILSVAEVLELTTTRHPMFAKVKRN